MKKQAGFHTRRNDCLLTFFLLIYVFSWAFFVAIAVASPGPSSRVQGSGSLHDLLYLPGVFAPAFAALALTARAEGRIGVVELLRGITKWQVGARWYVFAIFYMAAIKLATALLYRLSTGNWPQFARIPFVLMLATTIISTPVQAGEEIGWRGYALPRLTNRFGLGTASILLGLIWACWHLPFFFIPGSDNVGQSFPVYLLAVTAISVAMAWIYWRTNGSLLLVMLMHAAMDNTAALVTSPTPATVANPFALPQSPLPWFTTILLWICAAYFLLQMRKEKLRC